MEDQTPVGYLQGKCLISCSFSPAHPQVSLQVVSNALAAGTSDTMQRQGPVSGVQGQPCLCAHWLQLEVGLALATQGMSRDSATRGEGRVFNGVAGIPIHSSIPFGLVHPSNKDLRDGVPSPLSTTHQLVFVSSCHEDLGIQGPAFPARPAWAPCLPSPRRLWGLGSPTPSC